MKVIKNIITNLILVLFAVNVIAAEKELKIKKSVMKSGSTLEF